MSSRTKIPRAAASSTSPKTSARHRRSSSLSPKPVELDRDVRLEPVLGDRRQGVAIRLRDRLRFLRPRDLLAEDVDGRLHSLRVQGGNDSPRVVERRAGDVLGRDPPYHGARHRGQDTDDGAVEQPHAARILDGVGVVHHGSVWTTTSATPGRAARMRSETAVASSCASASETPPSSAEGHEDDEPVVRDERAEPARTAARDRFDGPLDLGGVVADDAAGGRLGERLEMGVDGRHLRRGAMDLVLDLLGDRVRLGEREVAGELEVERRLDARRRCR